MAGDGTFADIMANPADGTSSAAPNEVLFGDGKVGGAFDLVKQAFVEAPDANKLDLNGPLTLESWIYLRSLPANGSYRIIDKESAGGSNGYNFDVIAVAGGPKLRIILGGSFLQSNAAITTLNTWIHVAATFDGTMGRLYIDGVEQGAKAMTAPPINTLALRAWWTGDGTFVDKINGLNGTGPTPATFGSGKVSGAFQMSGGMGEVVVADNALLDFTSATPFSIEAWVNPTSVGSARIVDKQTANTQDGYLLDMVNGKPRFWVGNLAVNGATSFVAGQWHHVTGTYNGTNKLRIYLNGVLLALGSPGGATIITTVLQVLVNHIDFKMPIDEALAAPRVSQRNASDATARSLQWPSLCGAMGAVRWWWFRNEVTQGRRS